MDIQSKQERVREQQRLATARYRVRHKDRLKEVRRTKYKPNEAAAMLRRRSSRETWAYATINSIRNRAKKRGLECTITAADIHVPLICPVLDIPILLGKSSPMWNRPSVDRFNNNLGYTPDNIRVISLRANLLKKDATAEEIRKLLNYMEGISP